MILTQANSSLTAASTRQPIRNVAETLAALDQASTNSPGLLRKPLPSFSVQGSEYFLPRYLFLGPKGGAEPIRIGLFAGVHGTEPEGTFALIEFTKFLEQNPDLARDYCLFIYPLLNPSGFEFNTRHTLGGTNIPRELWTNSLSPEVQVVQTELWMHGFDGIIYLNTTSTPELVLSVGGPSFARHLLASALEGAQEVLPQEVRSTRDTLPPIRRSTLNEPGELIRAAPGLKPRPFEVVISLPAGAPGYLQSCAVNLLLRSALTEYRNFISFAANI